MDKYDDIINFPHHTSSRRPRMSAIGRAAQFSPFAALTGYDDAVNETARLTERKIDLTEEEQAALNDALNFLSERLPRPVVATYFIPDPKKDGGRYATISGMLRKIKPFEQEITVEIDGENLIIPIADILALEVGGRILQEHKEKD